MSRDRRDLGDYDVIVAGAGSAGLPCAIRAGEGGARVLLIERSGRVGGTLHVSGGQLSAAGTRRQRLRGIEDRAEWHLADVLRINHGTGREDLIRLAVENAAATVDWLEDHLGLELAPECPAVIFVHEPYSVARTYWGLDQARSILRPLEAALEPLLADGRVELRLGTRLTGLAREGGAVVGVEADGPDGPVRASARATVLTCGGYSNDQEMFAELHGRPLYSAGMETSTADGLRAGLAAGSRIVGAENWMPTFGGLPGPEDPRRVLWADRLVLRTKLRLPWEIYVTAAGRRFVAEDEESVDAKERALQRIESLTFFVVFDAGILASAPPLVPGWTADELAAKANVRSGVVSAGSIGALAAAAGIDSAGLTATVRAYNDAVAAGGGDELGRRFLPAPIAQPPFYALENHGITLSTFAGLDVGPDLAVRDAAGATIRGLYAAGETIGSGATTGNAFCSGMVITPALTFGRLLGERLGARQAIPA